MKTASKTRTMIAFAAMLSVPGVVAAQSTPPAARVLPPPSAAVTTAPRPMVSADSTCVTADQNVRASKFVGASV